jgi:hypothetical protein
MAIQLGKELGLQNYKSSVVPTKDPKNDYSSICCDIMVSVVITKYLMTGMII